MAEENRFIGDGFEGGGIVQATTGKTLREATGEK
jgi:hypothetical protein